MPIATLAATALDCPDPRALAEFYAAVLGGRIEAAEADWVVIEGAQFADYLWPAMEQIIECSHEFYRTNGQFAPNIVMRLAEETYLL